MSDDIWSAHDKYPKHLVECKCGTQFTSHSRFDGSRIMIVSREPCPNCGNDELNASYGEWHKASVGSSIVVTNESATAYSLTVMGNTTIDYNTNSNSLVPIATTTNIDSAIESEVDILRKVLRVVREYPDFDKGGILVDMMDEALAGKRPALLDKIDALSKGELYGTDS